MTNKFSNSKEIKAIATRLGFMGCGISKAEFLEHEASRFEKWLNKNHHGTMSYMERNFDKRLDPRKLVPGAKSVISLLYNYFPSKRQKDKNAPKLAKYAYGKDYHKVIKDKMYEFTFEISKKIGEVNGRVFVDSAPILEKSWAAKSGLGWVGKNTNLIRKNSGSFFFISQLIIDLELDTDSPVTDHCGTCTACIDACPTNALHEHYKIDASKCISYLTIELKESIPSDFKGSLENWVFGCDICQDVCPWNRFSKPHNEEKFNPSSEIMGFSSTDWYEITHEVYKNLFKSSAIERAGYVGLKRNLEFLKNN